MVDQEILHLQPEWPIVLAVFVWILVSGMITVIAVRESLKREGERQQRQKEEDEKWKDL